MAEIGIQIGMMCGFAATLAFASWEESMRWRVVVAVGIVLPVAMMYIAWCFLSESPRFLVTRGRTKEASDVLKDIYPSGYRVDLVVVDIQEALERERLAEHSVAWQIILHPTPAFQRILFLGWGGVAFAQQAVGIDAIGYYVLDVIDQAGIVSTEKQALCLLGMIIIKLQCTILCGKMLDVQGRRFVLFLSLMGMAISLATVSVSFFMSENAQTGMAMIGLTFYLGFYGLGMGPTSRLVASEFFPTSIRARAMSVATVINRAMAALVTTTFLSVKNALTWPGFFMLISTSCAMIASFLYFYLPETKGHSLEDMSLYFSQITGDTSIVDAERQLRDEAKGAAGTEQKQEDRARFDLNTSDSIVSLLLLWLA